MDVIEINNAHNHSNQKAGDLRPEEIVFDKDDWIKAEETGNPEEMYNNPFVNEHDEEKDEDNFKNVNHNEKLEENEILFKSFDKFAKFISIEEKMFTENSVDSKENESIAISDKSSVRSAIYGYELRKGIKKRLNDLVVSRPNHARHRSLDDRVWQSKVNKMPKNIRRLRTEIKKQSEHDLTQHKIDHSNEVRKSELLEALKRESILYKAKREETKKETEGNEQAENNEDFLEGMPDPFGKDWIELQQEWKMNSVYCDFDTYTLRPMIFKSNDDLRQELLAIQLLKRLKKIFDEANLSLYLRPYEITITSWSSGYIEWIPNSASIDSLKKSFPKDSNWTVADFFERRFVYTFEESQKNFVESLAGYSFFWYLFNVKDRHNGNILLDNKGHLIHIDFGFMFSNSPGGINFESAPFKLTQDYIDIMGGPNSQMFEYFKSLLNKAFYEVRKHLDDIISMIEIMFKESLFPWFKGGPTIFDEIRKRCSTKYNVGDNLHNEFQELVDRIIGQSLDNWRTKQYDVFQKWTNNIER